MEEYSEDYLNYYTVSIIQGKNIMFRQEIEAGTQSYAEFYIESVVESMYGKNIPKDITTLVKYLEEE